MIYIITFVKNDKINTLMNNIDNIKSYSSWTGCDPRYTSQLRGYKQSYRKDPN